MAKYLESHIKDLQEKTCLELGAGTGLVSIVAWLLGKYKLLTAEMQIDTENAFCFPPSSPPRRLRSDVLKSTT